VIQTARIAGSAFQRTLPLAWLMSGFLAALAPSAQADWQIPADASVQLSGGHIGLGATDLAISGSLALGAGSIDLARNVSINSGGLLDAGSGSLELTGNWSKVGNFLAGSSTVRFIDGALAQSAVYGDTLFHDLSFVSSTGKTFVLAVASTQSIEGLLTILGVPGQAIQMASATAGQVASINLLPGGSQNIHNVGVSDVHAIGQPQAPYESNQGGSGNDLGWFGNTEFVEGIPLIALSPQSLAMLGLLLVMLVLRRRRVRNK
jgi:hypothetical protein